MKKYNRFDNHMILIGIVVPFLVFFMSLNVTYAFFTATAKKQETTASTAVVKIQFTDATKASVGSGEITGSTKILPGDTVSINGAVKNTGNAKIYYILEFSVNVQKPGETQATNAQTKYYSLNNSTLTEIIVKTDGTYSATAATLDASATSSNFNIEYKFDFYEYDNSYKNATAIYSLKAHAIQFPNIADATQATNLLYNNLAYSKQYQKVEYIESSGTQYINTLFTPNQNTRLLLDFQLTEKAISMMAGSRSAYGKNGFMFNMGGSSASPNFVASYGNSTAYNITLADTSRHVLDFNKNKLTWDANLVNTFDEATFTCPDSMCLFAAYSASNVGLGSLPTKARIYGCSIYDNGTLVRSFVPCYKISNNEIGLYDLVSGSFFSNAGTGEFTKGANI